MLNKCYIGDCRVGLRAFVAAGLRPQMCVTSPPYWGLRDYGIEPSVWGGLLDCKHEWGDRISINKGGPTGNSSGLTNRGANQARTAVKVISAGQFCQVFTCGAWLGTLGLEPDYRMYIDHMVEVMDLVREVLADDGTLWLNLGDSYQGGDRGKSDDGTRAARSPLQQPNRSSDLSGSPNRLPQFGLKPKDLCMMPARVAIALQEAGWWVRQDIIWHKPNPMPESVTDRCTKSHEYLFLLTKSKRYYYNSDAIREPHSNDADKYKSPDGWDTSIGDGGHGSFHIKGCEKGKRAGISRDDYEERKWNDRSDGLARPPMTMKNREYHARGRNKRSVWTIPTAPYSAAHFATFPRSLIEPCILAGSRPGQIVLDPFMGSGTTAQVAEHLGRQWIGCEINPEYAALQANRLRQQTLEFDSQSTGEKEAL